MTLALLASPRDAVKGNTQIVDSWGAIERVSLWQNAVTWLIPRLTWDQSVIAWSIRGSFAILFISQILAFVASRGRSDGRLLPWLMGPIGAFVIMLFMPPANSDVFYYSMSASLAAENVNPYSHTLMQFPDHPLLPFNHWIDIGSVYGPVWTWIGKAILTITGPEPIHAITGYRIFMAGVALLLTLTAYRIALLLTVNRSHAISAAVLVAWQPNMVFETVGQVHNDALVMLLALSGLFLVLAGGMKSLRGGIVLATLSSATKFVTLPIMGLLVLLRVREAITDSRNHVTHVKSLLADLLAIVAVYIATFMLFWVGPSTISEMVNEPARLFAHPFWRLIEWSVSETTSTAVTNAVTTAIRIFMMLLTLVVFTWASLRTMGWYKKPDLDFHTQGSTTLLPSAQYLLFTILITELVLSLIPANAHPWYQVWSVSFVGFWTIYSKSANVERLVAIYVTLIGLFTIVYHTRIMQ